MRKRFNIAGPCVGNEHYMVPTRTRCRPLQRLVDEHQYFVLHAPRQVGKTTVIGDFVDQLNAQGHCHALYVSLEIGQGVETRERGIAVIIDALKQALLYQTGHAMPPMEEVLAESALCHALRRICAALDKPLVLMFDEVDCLDEAPLISFLRQIRQGYVERARIPFVDAMGLVGMRNIRDYKAAIREGRETLGGASPFNIVTEALTLPNFERAEVEALYAQHTEATGQFFPPEVVDKIMYYTEGQPWLCNAVAREIVQKILDGDPKQKITKAMVEQAVDQIILRRDTHIDSLLERLKEPRVRRVLEPVIVGRRLQLDFTDDDIQYVQDLGLVVLNKGDVKPANPIYAEVIMRMLTLNSEYHLPNELEGGFVRSGKLDVSALLRAFQQFWRENSTIWVEKYSYKEAAPHLILQAFLQRVVNSGGRFQREYSAGRGRVDLCISFAENRNPIELKIRGNASTREGLQQLGDYMDGLGLNEGWLVLFERSPKPPWSEKISWETKTHHGKTIHIVGC